MSTTPEGKVKNKVKELFKRLGIWYFMPVPGGRGVAGIPDFIACMPVEITEDMVGKHFGLFVAVETKAPSGSHRVTPLQAMHLRNIQAAHGVGLVASDADLLEIELRDCVRKTKGSVDIDRNT